MEQEPQPHTLSEKRPEGDYVRLEDLIIPFLRTLWENRLRLAIINSVVLVLAIVHNVFFVDSYYDSIITIFPDYGSKSSNIGLLASVTGISLGDGGASTEIYQNLLTGEVVLDYVVNSKFKTLNARDSVTLFDYYGIQPDIEVPVESRVRKMNIDAYNNVRSHISISTDKLTRILTLRVRMYESEMSAQVANKLVEGLDDYVRTKRKSNSLLQRSYIEKRLSEVSDSLVNVEDELERFQLANRGGTQSPTIMIAQSRLLRQVQILQGVYIELARQLEIAKIDIIKDAPIINVKEYVAEPVKESGPNRRNRVIILLFVSITLSVAYYTLKKPVLTFVYKLGVLKSLPTQS